MICSRGIAANRERGRSVIAAAPMLLDSLKQQTVNILQNR